MKMRNKEKINTLIYCEQVLREAEKEAEKESIKHIEAFKSKRKHKFRLLDQLEDKDEDIDLDDFEDELLDDIRQLEDDLLGVEMKLSEALQTSTGEFQEKIKKILEEMKSKTATL
jgi:hypothetical protein